MSIRRIVFDFGNVLGFFSRRKAAEQLAVYGAASAESIEAHVFAGRLEEDFESGRLTAREFRDHVRERFNLRCDDSQFDAAYADMFTPNVDVAGIAALVARRSRVLLLSNTDELHARQFRLQFAVELAPFDALVLSYEVGLRKPDPRLYEHCRQVANCPAAACLLIDDLPANVEAARAAGWRGIVYRRGDDLRAALAENGVEVDAADPV
jgi:putative hydrolase of the HAD superfamily